MINVSKSVLLECVNRVVHYLFFSYSIKSVSHDAARMHISFCY